jgi:DNA-binding response OmpR family regulator
MQRVLLVEDDADARDAIAQALTADGVAVLAADEGRKALELFDSMKPSLILLDLMTGGMTGWEFLERRRASEALARVPVIVITGSPDAVPEAQVVLRKPFEMSALLEVVRRLLRDRRNR